MRIKSLCMHFDTFKFDFYSNWSCFSIDLNSPAENTKRMFDIQNNVPHWVPITTTVMCAVHRRRPGASSPPQSLLSCSETWWKQHTYHLAILLFQLKQPTYLPIHQSHPLLGLRLANWSNNNNVRPLEFSYWLWFDSMILGKFSLIEHFNDDLLFPLIDFNSSN